MCCMARRIHDLTVVWHHVQEMDLDTRVQQLIGLGHQDASARVIAQLEGENAQLEKEIAQLDGLKAQLEKENAQLEN